MTHYASTRRRFLQSSAGLLACAAPSIGFAADPPRDASLKLGVASYTFRKFNLEKTISLAKRAGLKYICLKSLHLPLEATPSQIADATRKIADAGLVLCGVGVITMQTEAQVSQAFDYAKAVGVKQIVAAPSASMLPQIEQKARQYDIAVAIHNHGPGDQHFPTPQSVYEKIKPLDRRLGLCIDIGHTVRVGANLLDAVDRYADRLMDIHIKDVSEASPKAHEVPVGRGVIDIPGFLRALVRVNYSGVIAFEYEPDPDAPLPGLAESVGYTRGVLASLVHGQ